jgi:hypothetical protein
MARTKTEADRKEEQDAEAGKGEVTDTSGIPVGEEVPNLEAMASPSVAGEDLNPQDESAETGPDTSDASVASGSTQKPGTPATTPTASTGRSVDRGMVTAARQTPPVMEAATEFLESLSRDQVPGSAEFSKVEELRERERQEALQQDARRLASQPNTDVFQTEVEQREAALRAAAKSTV